MLTSKTSIVRTVRRKDAEWPISLSKRRAWFADSPDGGNGSDSPTDNDGGQSDDSPASSEIDLSDLPESVRSYINDLHKERDGYQDYVKRVNDEAAQRRIENKKKQAEIERLEKMRREQLAEQGNYKELADQYKNQLDSVLPYKERTEALENLIRDSNKQRIQRIPEDYRSLVPDDLPPERVASWLDANEAKLLKPAAPNLDAGAGGGSGQGTTPKLTAEEKQIAARFGMTEEEYTKRKGALSQK